MDRWNSAEIRCTGGLVLNIDTLTQGATMPGSARILQNFEPSIGGGYRRISGYTKFDSTVVPGTGAVLGVKVALGGVFAVRKASGSSDNRIFFSSGSGWSSALNSAARNNTVTKARGITYSISAPVVVITDGANPAWKYNGTTDTLLNGAGAPTNPKYAAFFRNRLVLSGYSSNVSAIILSAPNDDTTFSGSGAIEINVGDKVKGIATFRETLYIFCENTIKKLTGTSSSDFAIENVSLDIGCLSHDSIKEVGGDIIFLSQDGYRSLAATERVDDIELGLVSYNIQPLIADVISAALSEEAFSACTIGTKSQYRCFINDSSNTEADSLAILGKFQDNPSIAHGAYEWSTIIGIKPQCCDSDFTNNQEYVVFGHLTNGYVYRMESGSTFDGTNINAIYRSPDITFLTDKADSTIRKVFHKLAVYSQVEGTVDFSVALKLDRELNTVIQPNTIALAQSGSVPTYGSGIYGTSVYGALTYPVFNTNLVGSGFTGAFLYTCSNNSAPFRIDSFTVTLANKGRR